MNPNNIQLIIEELKQIDETENLEISPFREDGLTYDMPTWIWAVVVYM